MAWGGKWHLGDIRRTWRDSMWDRHWELDLALRGQTLRTSDGTEGTEVALRGHWEPGVALKGHDGWQRWH